MSLPHENPWLEITVAVHPDGREAVSAFLFDLGCSGILTTETPRPEIRAYLPRDLAPAGLPARVQRFLDHLCGIFPRMPVPDFSLTPVRNEDWASSWRRFHRPLRVSEQLLVLPEWESAPGQMRGHIIRIDPGSAFGTGQHPTTQMCLRAMETLAGPSPWSLLDVGTGSGILAIYGAKLGAERILAIDVDPEALRWAGRNLELNGVANCIELSSKNLGEIRERFSLVVANLILGELRNLADLFPPLVPAGGHLVLSGVLEDQVAAVSASFPLSLWQAPEVHLQEEWVCLVMRRNDGP